MARPVKMVVDELIAAMMARPESFSIGEHTLKDTRTGYEYWIASTRLDSGVWRPFQMKFGPWQSCRFHRALRALKAYQCMTVTRAATPFPVVNAETPTK